MWKLQQHHALTVWSTGVEARAISSQFIKSSLDPLNRPPVDQLPQCQSTVLSATEPREPIEFPCVCDMFLARSLHSILCETQFH
ncbi:hypothetical protein UY3_07676 [Chelonia mydas]|uniref:Uncharacterized protein n=1 Tax=Chelonia mydas TaxID=8469 RepID=M7BHP3_CHEMY|nr:hypothetical protein UY3_07676 [Chelonia mydas]